MIIEAKVKNINYENIGKKLPKKLPQWLLKGAVKLAGVKLVEEFLNLYVFPKIKAKTHCILRIVEIKELEKDFLIVGMEVTEIDYDFIKKQLSEDVQEKLAQIIKSLLDEEHGLNFTVENLKVKDICEIISIHVEAEKPFIRYADTDKNIEVKLDTIVRFNKVEELVNVKIKNLDKIKTFLEIDRNSKIAFHTSCLEVLEYCQINDLEFELSPSINEEIDNQENEVETETSIEKRQVKLSAKVNDLTMVTDYFEHFELNIKI